jgi:hypothetical protein
MRRREFVGSCVAAALAARACDFAVSAMKKGEL